MVLTRIILKTGHLSCQLTRHATLVNHLRFPITNLTSRSFQTSTTLQDRLYTDKHEWVEIKDNVGVVGISKYAQEALGDVVFAQLPDKNTVLSKKDECGALESVKAASELYSPVSGKVIEKNGEVEDKPSLINSSCYEKGWLFKVEITNADELKDLMSEKQYEEFLKTQDH